MKKTLKNILKGIIVIVFVILIVLLVQFAWSKYIVQIDGQATAQIARFNFELVNEIEKIQEVPNLAKTRNDENNKIDINSIAPDTHGVFEIGVNATGTDTAMAYEINIEVINKPQNLHFYSVYNKEGGYNCQLDSSDGKIRLTGFMDYFQTGQEIHTIYWNWNYETGDSPDEIELNDKADSDFMGQISSINIVAKGHEVMNPKIKKSNGEIITLTKSNVAQYYGEEVEYIGSGENEVDHRTYRLFYVDFDNKYNGGVGAIYLKADTGTKTISLEQYASYESNDMETLKKICPQWSIEDGIVDSKNDNVVSYLTDSTQWEKYSNSSAQYAIGTPSVEIFFDSYNKKYGTNYLYRVGNKNGSVMSKDGGKHWWTCYGDILSNEDIMYIGNMQYVLASNLGKTYENLVLIVQQGYKGINNGYFKGYNCICPVVCLKMDVIPKLK